MAAGIGRGIDPLSKLTPKPLVPVANRPLIEHLIRNFQKLNISEIIILAGYLGSQIRKFVEKLALSSVKIKIINAKNYEKGPLYTFSAAKNEKFKEDFILCPADLFTSPDLIASLIQFHKKGTISIGVDSSKLSYKGTHVFTYSQSRLNSQNKSFNCGRISGFNNRILNKSGDIFAAIPLIICPFKIFNYVEEAIEQDETQVVYALNNYIKKLNSVNYLDLPNYFWFDIDSLSEILIANKYALNHNIMPNNHIQITQKGNIEELLSVQQNKIHSTTEIFPPVLIGKNCYSYKHPRLQALRCRWRL